MTRIAMVFGGQGSQQPGMGTPWSTIDGAEAWAVADDVLGIDVTRLGRDADAEELTEPATCQIALFTHAAAVLGAWRAAGGPEPVVAAGHSLGEYAALLTAGVVDLPDGLRLVRDRATVTAEAARSAPGRMVACLGIEPEVVEAAAAASGTHVANDNAPGQIVVAGTESGLADLTERLADAKGKVVALSVGAAYHSPHMASATEPYATSVAAAALDDAQIDVVANVDAAAHRRAAEWRDLCVRQITSPVRWRQSVAAMAALDVDAVVELGATPVLSGMIKRCHRSLTRHHVTTPAELDTVLAALVS